MWDSVFVVRNGDGGRGKARNANSNFWVSDETIIFNSRGNCTTNKNHDKKIIIGFVRQSHDVSSRNVHTRRRGEVLVYDDDDVAEVLRGDEVLHTLYL